MAFAELNRDRCFARDFVAQYDRRVIRDPEGKVTSRPADPEIARDVMWLVISQDDELVEMGLYVYSIAPPDLQASLYTRVRFNDGARAAFARFVDSELRIAERDPVQMLSPERPEGLLEWTAVVQARQRWQDQFFAALEDHDRDDLRQRLEDLRGVKVGGYGAKFR